MPDIQVMLVDKDPFPTETIVEDVAHRLISLAMENPRRWVVAIAEAGDEHILEEVAKRFTNDRIYVTHPDPESHRLYVRKLT